MKVFKIIFLISLMEIHSFSWATITLKAPQTSRTEFNTYIKTEQAQSYSQFLLEKIRQQEKDVEQLIFLLEQAQEAFLKDHLKTAGEYFQLIVQKADEKDWVEEVRRIIFYSFLRLAQIEWKSENPEIFLHSALLFDFDLEPDSSLFPPPLIQKFSSLKKDLPRISLYLKHIFPFHEIILINGKVFFQNDKPDLPYGQYRVTALSSSHKTWKKNISLSHLSQKKIITPSWVSGSCSHPVVPKKFMDYRVLFPDFCWWSKPLNSAVKHSKKSLKNVNLVKSISEKPASNFLRKNKKWIALGLGFFVISAVVVQSQKKQSKENKSKKKQPTIKVGF